MQKEDKPKSSMQSDLVMKNSQLHAQRLKKLQFQLSDSDPITKQSVLSKLDMTTQSKYPLKQTKGKTISLNQTAKRQIIFVKPIEQNRYFYNLSLKNIDNENKILFKKIQRIIKGNKKRFSFLSKDEQKHSVSVLSHLQDDKVNQNSSNVTFLAEQMSKKRATQAQMKQKQIRDANQKMLDRLMSIKPTIETRKILTDSQKNKTISQRLSRFNTFHSTDSEKDESQKDTLKGQVSSVGRKKLSLDNRLLQKQSDYCKQREKFSKKKFSTGQVQNFIDSQKKNPYFHRRTLTQPVESLSQIKLPFILSPTNQNNFTTLNVNQKDFHERQQHSMPKSLNERQKQLVKNNNQPKIKKQKKLLGNHKRANSLNDAPQKKDKMNHIKIKDKLSDKRADLQGSQRQKIFQKIILGRVQKMIEENLITFTFVRSTMLYQIQINKKKANKKSTQKSNKKLRYEIFPQSLVEQYPSCKMYSPKEQKRKLRQRDFVQQKNQQSNSSKLSFKDNRIILNEIVGSQLFSYLDYDYNKIIEECLELRRINNQQFTIEMKDEYYNFRQPRQVRRYKNQCIRENDQDEEEDSYEEDKGG